MKNIIKQILKEDRQEQFLNKIILLLKDDYPIFNKLDDYGFNLSEEEMNYVLSGIFGEPVRKGGQTIYDENRNKIYAENERGNWYKKEYDENRNMIYREDSDGHLAKIKYDENGNEIYHETSTGYWAKREYDDNGNEIYYEYSDGYITDYR